MVNWSSTRWIRTGAIAALAAAALLALAAVPRAPAAGSSTPACTTSELVVWLDTRTGGVAAGSAYVGLRFTNLSGHTCTVRGYPGVSAVTLAGRQLGRAAARDRSVHPRTVALRAGQTAMTTLQIGTAANYPRASCRPAIAAGIRVYPPNQTAARVVPYPFPACSRRGPVILIVRPVGVP
jgi:uncharacterized protein DUF4232